MSRRLLATGLVSMLAAGLVCAQEAPAPPAQAPAAAEGYVWAAECKTCHEAIFDAWSKTKHARSINRLSADQRQKGSECIGCHVTGPKEPIEVAGEVVNADIQCEGCHGPGKAHVEAAKAGNAKGGRIVKSPAQTLCETCHNDKSPHYRGFFFAAFKGLVHKH